MPHGMVRRFIFYGFTAYTGNLYTLYTVIRRVYAENPGILFYMLPVFLSAMGPIAIDIVFLFSMGRMANNTVFICDGP